MNKDNYNRLINYSLIANIAIYLYFFLEGYDRPFWFDEIHVIGISKDIYNKSFSELFSGQLLPPLYFYLVGSINFTEELKSTVYEDHYYYLRIVNLLGFIPLIYGFKILKEKFEDLNISFLILLIISSNFFYYYSIELKMYFIIFGLSFLIHTIFLVDENQIRYKFIFFISSILLTLLHVFGLVIAMSMIFFHILRSLQLKNFRKLIFNLFTCSILIILFSIMYYYSKTHLQTLSWLEFQKWYFRVFIEWTFPTVIIILIMSIKILSKENLKYLFSFKNSSEINLNTVRIILPSLILLLVTSLISLKIPVITHRNLIVIFPSGILLAGLLSMKYFNYKKQSIILAIFLVLISIINFKYYSKNLTTPGENIKWVIKKSFTENCKNVPIYLGDESKTDWKLMVGSAIDLYADYYRPIKRLSKINKNELKNVILNNKKCDIYLANFHYRNFDKKIYELNNDDLNFEILFAPNTLKSNSKAGSIAILIK